MFWAELEARVGGRGRSPRLCLRLRRRSPRLRGQQLQLQSRHGFRVGLRGSVRDVSRPPFPPAVASGRALKKNSFRESIAIESPGMTPMALRAGASVGQEPAVCTGQRLALHLLLHAGEQCARLLLEGCDLLGTLARLELGPLQPSSFRHQPAELLAQVRARCLDTGAWLALWEKIAATRNMFLFSGRNNPDRAYVPRLC